MKKGTKKRCDGCQRVRRRGRTFVICQRTGRHKRVAK